MASAANNMLRLITPPNFPTPIDKSDSTVATGNARKLQSLPTPTLGLPPPNNTTTTLVQSSDLASKALSKLTSEPAGTVAHDIVMLKQASAEKNCRNPVAKQRSPKTMHMSTLPNEIFSKKLVRWPPILWWSSSLASPLPLPSVALHRYLRWPVYRWLFPLAMPRVPIKTGS